MESARLAAENADKELLLLKPDSEIKWEKMDGVLDFEPASETILPLLPP